MKDFEALKSIWHNQVALPKVSHEDVLKKVGKTRTGLASRLLVEMVGMVLASAMLIYVWVESPFRMWTTHLAMVIFMACCLYYITALIDNYRRITYRSLLNSPGEYILYLKKYKHDRFIFNTRNYRIYSIFFTAGFILLFIEISFLTDLWVTITVIVFTFLWIMLFYFVLMRIYIRKEESKLEDMIRNLERLEKQFEEEG
jgi:magnesium-transporting ATPase (P-type)